MDFALAILQNVPAHAEARIKQLYTEALAAKTLADVDRILPELRSALEEHVRLAKEDEVSNSVWQLGLLPGCPPVRSTSTV